MTLETIVAAYGYPALFVGTILEGESILVIAGFLAHRGLLFLPWVVLIAFIGSFFGDQLFFHVGRNKGRSFLDKRPKWQPKVSKVQRMFDKYNTSLILGFRFLYGLRTVTPFMFGMSNVSTKKFMILNAVGALIWAIVVGLLGFIFGHVFQAFLDDFKQYELWIIVGAVLTGGLYKLYQHFSDNKRNTI